MATPRGRRNVGTGDSFEAAARRINAFRLRVESTVPDVSVAVIIAEEIKTDVAASRPGAGVPRDMGDLAASLTVEGGGRGLVGRATLSAGGSAAPYALIQHERLDYHHTVGEARYLVRGIERWRPDGSRALRALKENVDAAVRATARQ